MGNPSEGRDSGDADNNDKFNMTDIISDATSDELIWYAADDGDLFRAINSESSAEAVSQLISCNTVTQDGLSQALISACRRGHKQLVQTLVRVGAYIEHRDENGNTPLLICAENGFTDIVRFLVSRHASVSAVNSVGNTALILSIRSAGSTDLTRFLLEQQGVDIHHENQHGCTALHRAIYFMDVDMMRLLLQKSLIPGSRYSNNLGIKCAPRLYFRNSSSQMFKQTYILARAGLSGVYEILKEHVITGTSPLELAIRVSDINSLEIFLDCQFSSSSEKKEYVDSALMYIFTSSHNTQGFSSTEMKIIKRLLQYGANVNKRHGSTLLSRAVESGDFQLVELLRTHGAQVTTYSDSRKRDSLRIASTLSHGRVVYTCGEMTTTPSHGRVVHTCGEPTATPSHGRVVHTCGEMTTTPSHGRVVHTCGEMTTTPSHGRVVHTCGEPTATPSHDIVVHTCGEPTATPIHARHDHSSSESTASTTEAIVVTKVTNPSVRIPPGTLSSGTLSSEMGNPSEGRDSGDAGNYDKFNMTDIISDAPSDEPMCYTADDGHLLSAINSKSSSEAVSKLTSCNNVTQHRLNQALISACRRGHKHLVQTLVRIGANIEHRDENRNTPLLICAENGFTDIVRFLVSRQANVSAVNSVDNTALILSIRSAGSTDLTRFLLEQQGVDIHHENQHGHTALHRATYFTDVDTMRLLLQKSVIRNTGRRYRKDLGIKYETKRYFINCSSQVFKQTVIAARAGLSGVYEILKEHVITGTSPLELAVKASDINSLDMFLDCQFSSSSEMKRCVDSALMSMFPSSHHTERFSSAEMKIIQRLLQYGTDVNQGHGSALLSRAVELGDFQLVELLCTHGAHLNTHSYSRERDPLCIAAKFGRQDLIELLLKYQPGSIGGRFPDSALDYALRNNHIDCAKLLIQRRAKMDVKCALRSATDHQVPKYMHFLFENYKSEIMNHFSQSTKIARELLISAVQKGNCEIIGQILDAGVGVNEVHSYGQTPLKASKRGDVAKFLIQRGADVNQVTTGRNGIETPLIHMIHRRQCADISTVELCKVLIDNGASVNCRSRNGKTPLMMAASQRDCVDMLHLLLANGADVNDKDNKENTALLRAIMEQYSQNVSCLIDSAKDKKSVINVHNNEGLTPLMMSAQKGNIPIMKALIEGGSDVNMKDNQENTALHHLLIACYWPSEEMLACLLKAGSNVNCQNSDGLSPLMLAARKSLRSLMSSLLDAGADVNAVSKKDHSQTALSFIPHSGDVGHDTILCIQILLDRGASSSYLGHECLHRLIIQNKINIMSKIIQHGVVPAVVDVNKLSSRILRYKVLKTVSPLCVALLYGKIPLARYFVDILFLTSSDLSMFACNKTMKCLLKQGHQEDSLHLLQELSSQPMSLVQLSLVGVSSAVGPSPGRESRVDSLPLPQMMKDRLRFKSADDKHLPLSEHL